MIVAGLGFASKATMNDILAAVEGATMAHGLSTGDIGLIASIEEKRTSTALDAAARELSLPLEFVDANALDRVADRLMTHSQKSIENTGCPCVSEAAALACAGRDAALLGPRIIAGPVTCALARIGERDEEEIKT